MPGRRTTISPVAPATILGLSGKSRSGKDTLAAGLCGDPRVGALGYRTVRRVAFADRLKAEVADMLAAGAAGALQRWIGDWTLDAGAGDPGRILERIGPLVAAVLDEAETGGCRPDPWRQSRHVRALLQVWGTDVVRALDPDRWVRLTEPDLRAADGELVVVTDVRFPNERGHLRRWGALTVRLNAPRWLLEARGATGPFDHPSETALDDDDRFDLIVDAADGPGPLDAVIGLLADRVRVRTVPTRR